MNDKRNGVFIDYYENGELHGEGILYFENGEILSKQN